MPAQAMMNFNILSFSFSWEQSRLKALDWSKQLPAKFAAFLNHSGGEFMSKTYWFLNDKYLLLKNSTFYEL